MEFTSKRLRGALLGALLLGAPALSGASSEASRHYEEALRHFQSGDLDRSVVSLKQALTEDPALLSAHVLVARVYLAVGEAAAAEESLTRARRLGADPDIVWPLRAEALFRQYKLPQLLALTPEQGLGTASQSVVHVYRGRAHMERNEFDLAKQELQRAVDLTPSDAAPLVAFAVLALREGDPYAAEARAIKATRVAPEAAASWSARGDVMHVQGRLDEAVEAYGRALELDETHYDARLARAGVLLDLGRLEACAVDVKRLRAAQPLDPRPAYLESVLFAKGERPEEARVSLQRAAALLEEMGASARDRSMQMVLLAGIANYELGSFEQAQGYLARYVERFPQQPGPRKLLGSVLLRKGRTAEAILALEPALERAPGDYQLLSLLGTAYMQNGRHDIATRYLERAVELSAGRADMRTRLAASRVGAGFAEQGIEELRRLFEEDPFANHAAGMTLATMLLQRGRFAQALEVAAGLHRGRPQDLTVTNLLGAAQLGAGRLDEARASFGQALAQDPSFLPARVNLGKLEIRAGKPEAAREVLTEVLEQRPDSVAAMIELARVEQRLGRIGEGLRWLRKAQGTEPESRMVALALVDMLLAAGETEEAQVVAREAETREPENLDVLTALADTMVAARREDLALAVYEQMVRVAGFDPEAQYRIARLQLELRAEGAAMYTLSKALQGDAAHLPSRLLLARLQIRNGRLEQAAEAAQALLEERPELAAVHRIAGDVMLASGKPAEAEARYSRALELEPGSQHALRLFGAKASAGETADALAFLTRWVGDNPADTRARRALAESHLATGRLAEARVQYEQILGHEPRDAEALNNLATILDLQGDPAALSVAERALAAAPEDSSVLDTVGWMLVRQGKVERGLSYLRDAHSRAASNPEIRYHIASALVALERRDEARRELRQALASPAPFQGIADARSLLQSLGE